MCDYAIKSYQTLKLRTNDNFEEPIQQYKYKDESSNTITRQVHTDTVKFILLIVTSYRVVDCNIESSESAMKWSSLTNVT